jgi:hypothetical protein
LVPIALVATRGATLSGLYEESIGYRYFFSLRAVLGEDAALFLPQGQLQDLLSQALQIALNIAGYPLYDTAKRIDAFSYSLVASAMLLALLAFWLGNAERGEGPIACLLAATLWGSVFYLPGYNTVYALLQPDYLPFILAIAISANALVVRIALGGTLSPMRHGMAFGLFLGVCLATKMTLTLFAVTAMIVYLVERPHLRSVLVLAGAALLGCGFWFAAIKLDYRGSRTALSVYYRYLADFVKQAGGVEQTVPIKQWVLGKFTWDSYLHGALVALPLLTPIGFLLCPRARRSVLTAVIVTSTAYSYVLYQRDYPGTNLEVAIFVSFAFQCLWREVNRQFSGGVATRLVAAASIAVLASCIIVDTTFFRSTVLSIVRAAEANTTDQARLDEAIGTLPTPMLWLVPTNNDRMLTVHSAIMKGGSSGSVRGRSPSKTMRAISPHLDLILGTDLTELPRDVEEYRTLVFATAKRKDRGSVLQIEQVYGMQLSSLRCAQFGRMPGYRLIACTR